MVLAEKNNHEQSDTVVTTAHYLFCGSRDMQSYQNVIVESQEVLEELYKVWEYDIVCIRRSPQVDFAKNFYVIAGGMEYGCPGEFQIHANYRIINNEIFIKANYYVRGTCRGPRQAYFSLIAIPKELASYQINTDVKIFNKAIDRPPE